MRNQKPDKVDEFIEGFYEIPKSYYAKHRLRIIGAWEFFIDIILDPILFGYFSYTVFTRFVYVMAYADSHPTISKWAAFNNEMTMNADGYAILLFKFFIWMLGRVWKHNQDVKKHIEIRDSLKAQSSDMNEIRGLIHTQTESINKLVEEIKEDRNERKQHPNTNPKL